MFLYIMGEGAFNQVVRKFQHFGDIFSYIFYKVFRSLLYLYTKILNLPIKDNIIYP